jgi:WD40 repeat protein
LRTEAVAGLCLADVNLAQSREVPAAIFDLVFDAAFERYAYCKEEGPIRVCRATDNRELLRIPWSGGRDGAVFFSPQGSYLVINCWKREPQTSIWDLKQGKELVALDGVVAAFARDERTVWLHLSMASGEMRQYDLASRTQEKRFNVGPGWHAFALHPNGRQLAVSYPSNVQVWDLETATVVATLQGAGESLAWRPDGRFLAVSHENDISIDISIDIWDVPARKRQAVLRGHQAKVYSLAFNHAGDVLATTGWDQPLRLWEPLTGRSLISMDGGGVPPQFTHDDRFLNGTRSGTKYETWQVTSGTAVCQTFCAPAAAPITHLGRTTTYTSSVDFSADGRFVASGHPDGARLWDRAGREIAVLPIGLTLAVCFHQDNGSLYLFTGGNAGVHSWTIAVDPKVGARGLRVGPEQRLDESSKWWELALSRAGLASALADNDRVKALGFSWRVPGKNVVLAPAFVDCSAISPDGRWAATGSYLNEAAVVKIWDARTGVLARELLREEATGGARVAFSEDGRWLATSTWSEVVVWAAGSWERRYTFPRDHAGPRACPLAFTSDGTILAMARSNLMVELIDARTGAALTSLDVPDPQRIFGLRFSRDGSQLATIRDNQLFQVWDLRHIRQQLATLGLDWDLPPYPPAQDEPSGPLP